MKQRFRYMALWMLIVLSLALSVLVPSVFAAGGINNGIPTLFFNDTLWSSDEYYPALGYTIGVTKDFWIPLSFFEEIEYIKVRRDGSRLTDSFVISDTKTGKYLSFDTANNDYAQTERGTYKFIRTTTYNKERYVPMLEFCAHFGWTYEMAGNGITVRIADGRQTQPLSLLIEKYSPKDTQTTESERETSTESQTTAADTEPDYEEYHPATVHLTFEDIEAEYAPQIIRILREYQAKATFFITGEQLIAYTPIIADILAEGHSIGLHTMTGVEDDVLKTDAMLASFEEENALLYALTKRKVRLIRFPEGSKSSRTLLTDRQKKTLADHGYILWDWNVAAMDHSSEYDVDQVYAKILNGIQKCYNPVIRFHCTEKTVAVLPMLLQYVSEHPLISIKRITDASDPVVFP